MAELKQDPTHPLKHEQCYLCFTTLVEPSPAGAASRADLRRPHKEYMARLEREGRLFGAGLLKNDNDNEATSDLGYGMFILRAESRAEAEAIAFEEPNTKAGLRTMKVVPWLRGEGDINYFDQLHQRHGDGRSAYVFCWITANGPHGCHRDSNQLVGMPTANHECALEQLPKYFAYLVAGFGALQ